MGKCGFDYDTKRCNKTSSKKRSWCQYNKITGYCKKSPLGIHQAPKKNRLRKLEFALQHHDFDAVANILDDREDDIKNTVQDLISIIENTDESDKIDTTLESDEEWGPFVSAPEISNSRARTNWKKMKPMVKFISAAQAFTDIRTTITIKHLDLSLNSIMQYINDVYTQIQIEICQETTEDNLNIECQILRSLYQGIIQEGTEISTEYMLVKNIIDAFIEKIQEIYNIFYENSIPIKHPVNKFIEFVQEDYIEYANTLDRFSSYSPTLYKNIRQPELKHNVITSM